MRVDPRPLAATLQPRSRNSAVSISASLIVTDDDRFVAPWQSRAAAQVGSLRRIRRSSNARMPLESGDPSRAFDRSVASSHAAARRRMRRPKQR
jgi:hypothetical protein